MMVEPVWLQRQSFFRCWTAKEALLKTLGLGITEGLRALKIDPAGDGLRRPVVNGEVVFAGARTLQYHWLNDLPGYVGCVAFGEGNGIRTRETEAAIACAPLD